jgi:hypothetical protein
MTLPTISAENAKRLVDEGAILVDIREADEHSREKIPSAHHMPLSKLDEAYLAAHEGRPVLFHSGAARALSATLHGCAPKSTRAARLLLLRGVLRRGRRPDFRSHSIVDSRLNFSGKSRSPRVLSAFLEHYWDYSSPPGILSFRSSSALG